jgi:hypothetical protein
MLTELGNAGEDEEKRWQGRLGGEHRVPKQMLSEEEHGLGNVQCSAVQEEAMEGRRTGY